MSLKELDKIETLDTERFRLVLEDLILVGAVNVVIVSTLSI